MLSKSLFGLATMLVAASAVPTHPKASPTNEVKPEASASDAGANNGNQFTTECKNTGISIADCTDLLNIAALNGNSVDVGSDDSSKAAPGSVNNGQQFLNKCENTGVSVLDCSQLLNVAALNGNDIAIDLGFLADVVDSLGLTSETGLGGLLSGLTSSDSGLVKLPKDLL